MITRFFKTAILGTIILTGVVYAAERVGDFSLLDQIGNHHQMSWYDDNKSIALLVQANGSEATLAAIPRYIDLQKSYAGQGIQFFMINPMGRLNRDAVNEEISRYTTEIPVLMDDTRQVSADLGVNKSGEVFLFDPASFRVVFRGPVVGVFSETVSFSLFSGKNIGKFA